MRKLLYPFSLVYAAVIGLRNLFYDKGWLKSVGFDLPLIAVGNLSVGGTGKSPMVEYLIRHFREGCDLAILSRGYGRKTRGFILAGPESDAGQIGDEPYQFHRKFEGITVAVDEDRVHGVSRILDATAAPDLILLDDAYQHRRIKAGFYVLMTSYEKLYTEDIVLPAGDLREPASGARRANVIVVSKCPLDMTGEEKTAIRKKIRPEPGQELFFTGIDYSREVLGSQGNLPFDALQSKEILLVTGIANPTPLKKLLKESDISFTHMEFSDHHRLSQRQYRKIEEELSSRSPGRGMVLTTEKDYVRNFEKSDLPVYYLPIQTVFLDGEDEFIKRIDDYVRKNKRNG